MDCELKIRRKPAIKHATKRKHDERSNFRIFSLDSSQTIGLQVCNILPSTYTFRIIFISTTVFRPNDIAVYLLNDSFLKIYGLIGSSIIVIKFESVL